MKIILKLRALNNIFSPSQEYKSRETHLVLQNVDLTTSGKFRCEVSGEAPLFQTATFTNILIVVGKKLYQIFASKILIISRLT